MAAAELFAAGVTEVHGYQLARHLAERTEARLLTSHGTLYRALSRLESMGLLESRWELQERQEPNRPPRRLYRLTAAGAERARAAGAEVQAARAVRGRLGEAPA